LDAPVETGASKEPSGARQGYRGIFRPYAGSWLPTVELLKILVAELDSGSGDILF
jgi:hypothetical protein